MKEMLRKRYGYLDVEEVDIFEKILKYAGVETGESAEKYLNLSIKDFNHPFQMKDMEQGVDKLLEVLDAGGKVTFYGDYDADGVTTTALFVKGLNEIGYDNIDWFIPRRNVEGYGVEYNRVRELVKNTDLIITGDTGVKEMVSLYGLDVPVIVTDHHEAEVTDDLTRVEKLYGEKATYVTVENRHMAIPKVHSVINPKRIDCDYPNENLSGVAVIYKMLQGVYIKKKLSQKDLMKHLDMVAVGLVADLVPQFDKKHQDVEVRLMTALGLQVMNSYPSVWLKSLMRNSGKEKITFNDLGFFIGPNFNAPGRLDDGSIVVDYLLEEDEELSYELAQELLSINEERKDLQREAFDSLDLSGLRQSNKISIVRLDEKYDGGITGLVASGVEGKTNLPSLAFTEKTVDGKVFLNGSCRSIESVNILKVLQDIEKEIGNYRYGGHEQAAGVTIEEDRFEDFKNAAYKVMKDVVIPKDELFYEIEVPLNKLSPELIAFVESTYEKIRFYSEDNELYSPPTPKRNPEWVDVYLSRYGVKHRAVKWSGAEEMINEYSENGVRKIDVVYSASLWNQNVSLTLENYKVSDLP